MKIIINQESNIALWAKILDFLTARVVYKTKIVPSAPNRNLHGPVLAMMLLRVSPVLVALKGTPTAVSIAEALRYEGVRTKSAKMIIIRIITSDCVDKK